MVFEKRFAALTGNPPFPWQRALYERLQAGDIPPVCDIPTGLGKTSVIALWLLARTAGAPLPTRLVYIVNRRTVVDQTSFEVDCLRSRLVDAGIEEELAISTLRGQMADNRAWSADPSRLAVICGTVDMIGSRLLFSGYRSGFRTRPLHAGLLGQDALMIHDEAHLEPAFQHLLERIEREQRTDRDLRPLRVMALSATVRNSDASFRLDEADFENATVARRMRAAKRLTLHPCGEKELVERIVERALAYRDADRAVLVFLRSVDAVGAVVTRLRKAGARVQQLTGTMRGLERDRLVAEDPVMARFLPSGASSVPPAEGSVFLVCTSAGEVGVNISADHLVCDLSTFDSMAQRFGRVNRFGLRPDTEVHVFHPERDTLDIRDPVDARRLRTLELLVELRGDASPRALAALDAEARIAAFAPEPTILEATDILFDLWAMTTIRGEMPGRPSAAPYLHGVAAWEPPTTQVAWRDEVDLIVGELRERYPAEDLLEDYPLKPHELLRDRTARIVETLSKLAARHANPAQVPLWIVDDDGRVDVDFVLARVVEDDRKTLIERLADATVILPPSLCRPVDGLFTIETDVDAQLTGTDVADAWFGSDGQPLRLRTFDEVAPPPGMRLIRRIRLVDPDLVVEGDADHSPARIWSWYEVPRVADTEGSRSATNPVLLDVHCGDVEREAQRIVSRLPLAPGVRRAVVTAARLHDIGKARRLWQRSIGNTNARMLLAKSGGAMRPLEVTSYRHELGSIIDARQDARLGELEPDERELALHLVAAHHGRARPHFPAEELFDPEARHVDMEELAREIAERFASLQRRFGRWGLAYLESLVRAADYAASAQPSAVVEVPR